MRGNQFEKCLDEQVTILTERERIEGTVYFGGGSRLSDFLNAPFQQEFQFIKVKDPIVYLRPSGEEMGRSPFLMVARDRIVLLMSHAPADEPDRVGAPPLTPTARLLRREANSGRPA